MLAFVLLRNSRFNFRCYTQREATPTQKSARKWRCDLSRLLARKITKGIHSCKPASLNLPVDNYTISLDSYTVYKFMGSYIWMHLRYLCFFDCHADIDVCIYSSCTSWVCVKCLSVDARIYSTFNSIQFKNFNHPTRASFVVVMAGS